MSGQNFHFTPPENILPTFGFLVFSEVQNDKFDKIWVKSCN